MKKILFFLFIPLTLSAQSGAGYIDQDSVVQLLPEYKTANEAMTKRGQELTDTMNLYINFSENISFSYLDCQAMAKKGNPPTDSIMLVECDEVYDKAMVKYEADISNYKNYATQSYEILSNKLYEKLYQALQVKINEFCSKRKIEFLTDKVSLLYCPKCKDFTDEFIKFLKQK